MKPKQKPAFLNVYLDENGKETFSSTRKQPAPDTVKIIDDKEVVFKNPDVDVPNELLPGQFARNRAARRVVAAVNRKRK